ncbi:MAG: hypothetical protein R2910_02460 [Gemmatimonadales bacterium]
MTLAEASTVLGEQLTPGEEESAPGCSYIYPKTLPRGAALMVIDGRIERIDVDSAGILATTGAGVGSTEAAIGAMFPGRVSVEPHPYDPPPNYHDLIVESELASDSMFGMVFETDGKLVYQYRAGRKPAVLAMEGCS